MKIDWLLYLVSNTDTVTVTTVKISNTTKVIDVDNGIIIAWECWPSTVSVTVTSIEVENPTFEASGGDSVSVSVLSMDIGQGNKLRMLEQPDVNL